MALKIDDREVPAPAIGHWKQALDELPEAVLQSVARALPKLQEGFRPGKVPPPALRARTKALLDSQPGLPEALRGVLQAAGLQGGLVCVLSQTALEYRAGAWADVYGRLALASAMLLDDRAPVREAGFRRLLAWGGEEADTLAVARAREDLADAFAPFLKHLRFLRGPSEGEVNAKITPTAPAAATAPAPARAPRSSRERELLLALREERKRSIRAERESRTAQRERDALREQLEATTAARLAAETALAQVRSDLQATKARIDELVRQGVQAQLDERLRPWLAPSEALLHDVRTLVDDGVVAQAESLLRHQSEVDRREGLRSALVAELHRAQAALAEVLRAQVDALNPLPQLPEMAQRLRAHAAALQSRLDAASAFPPCPAPTGPAAGEIATVIPQGPLARLHQILAASPTLDALAALRRQLQAAESLSLLTAEELTRAYGLLHDAAGRLYDRSAMAAGVTRLPAPDARAFPLQALQRGLADRQNCVMVVDGHNVLHLLPTIFRPYYDQRDQPMANARKALSDRLLHLVARFPTLHVELWFDGPAQDTRTLSDRVRLHFSGGSGSDRADRAIVAHVRHLMAPGPDVRWPGRDRPVATGSAHPGQGEVQRVFVVTGDGDIRHESVALGASALLPVELGILLQ